MAESFLLGIAETLLGKLGSLAVQQIGQVVGATKELDKLRKSLKTIQAVRLDAHADQQLHHQMNNQLKDWLQRLKDICLDAEDVLDDFEIAALQQQLIQNRRRSVRKKVSHFFSSSNRIIFRYRMSHKIKEIREELDAIAADRDKFHTTTPNQNRESNRIVPEWRDTHSSASDIIGREDDIEHLVNVLMQMDPNGNSNSVDVVTIVGMGGLGKTALAKSLYNDQRVKGHFQLQKWVCVGEIFEAKTTIGKIVNNKDLTNMEDAHEALEETLSGKRYLLVLDDVWNEEVEKWNELMKLFMCGNKGSKIVVTTRSQSIAKFTSTTYSTHTLGGLLEKDCVSLLLEQALGKGQEDRFPDLVEIGKDIVKKCKGVPLAITSLGALLYMKTNKKEWCWVRDDKLLNLVQEESGILPALKLSFIHLPSYLKPCFSFCSSFDKDTEYNTEEMIGIWMALGYLQSCKSKSQLEAEDIGLDYFKKLWSKSFFQDVEEYRPGHYRFKMHDLMHDLAISLGKGEYASITPAEVESMVVSDHGQKVRHLAFPSLTDDSVKRGVPKSIVKQKGLRSIIAVGDYSVNSYKLFITSISEFKYSRVLVFVFTGLEVIPSSIGGLKHLRLLCLRSNNSIKTLPDSVCKLVGLETLDVRYCYGLERLPKDIGELVNLRSLYFTTQQRNFSHQTGGGGRGGIASLSSLRVLFLTWSHNLEYLFDLSLLTHLRTLEIRHCNRLKSLPPTLRNLGSLETLAIASCEDLDMMRMMTDNEQLTENIGGPDGSGDGLTSLRYLSIINIPKLVNIPSWLLHDLQHGVSLQHMRIGSCRNMTSLLGGETGGTTPYPLPPTLQKLTIYDCGRLDESCVQDTGEDWEYISHFPNIIINKQKVVIRVDMTSPKKSKARAMKIAATFLGVESVAIKGDNKDRLEVIGNKIDTVQLAKSLRKKVGSADLISVAPAKDDKKDEFNKPFSQVHHN